MWQGKRRSPCSEACGSPKVSEILDKRVAVTPGRATQLHTAVVWLPKWVEDLMEAELLADELLAKCPATLPVNGDDVSYTWTKGSALFLKLSGRKPSFGLRVPSSHAAEVLQAAGRDTRAKFVLKNTLPSWQSADVAAIFQKAEWPEACAEKPLAGGRLWQIRAPRPPSKWTLLVKAGYERVTLTIEESGVRAPPKPPQTVSSSTSWNQLARTTSRMQTGTNAWQSLGTARVDTSRNIPQALDPQPADPNAMDQDMGEVWEDDEWDCPGLGWDFEVDLEDPALDDLDDRWCERPSPSKRGREEAVIAPRDGVEQAMHELRAQNERLRAQVDALLKRLDQMCTMLQTQGSGSSVPVQDSGTLHAAAQVQVSGSPAPVQHAGAPPLAAQVQSSASLMQVPPGDAQVQPLPLDPQGRPDAQVEQVPAHVYQVTLQGEYITFPEWQSNRTFEEGQLAAVYRLPWHLASREGGRMSWRQVSGDNNLCWWRSLQYQLHRRGHHLDQSPVQLKSLVLEWALQQAAALAHAYNTDLEVLRRQLLQMRQVGAMATDLAVYASAVYFQLPIVVFEEGMLPGCNPFGPTPR
eukprot:3579846-Amphidinium_carterae.2